jgi:hypothetical protein
MTMTSADVEDPPTAAGTSLYAKWAIAIFFVVLFIPGSLHIGIRITPYRLYLILMAAPLILRFREDPGLKITIIDVLVFLAIAWRSLSILAVHQTSEIANAGSSFLELFFGYMLGRVFIRTAADYRFFFKCFLITLVAFLPFALLELTTRQRVLRNLFGIILDNPPTSTSDQIRFGLMRVQVSFEHAVLFGSFCVIAFANMFYIYRDKFVGRFGRMAFVAGMACMSLSSSAFLVLILQSGMIVYERIFRAVKFKWLLLGLAAVTLWFSFRLLVGMSVPEYIVSELVYNEDGSNARIDQMKFGMMEVRRFPWFGIGLNTYAHAFWRSSSIDNFWLGLAIKSGVPALVLMLAAYVWHFFRVGLQRGLDETETAYRNGYQITTFCLFLTLSIGNLWGSSNVFAMLYIGAGAWFYNAAAPAPQPLRRRPSPAPVPRARSSAPPPGGLRRPARPVPVAGPRGRAGGF